MPSFSPVPTPYCPTGGLRAELKPDFSTYSLAGTGSRKKSGRRGRGKRAATGTPAGVLPALQPGNRGIPPPLPPSAAPKRLKGEPKRRAWVGKNRGVYFLKGEVFIEKF